MAGKTKQDRAPIVKITFVHNQNSVPLKAGEKFMVSLIKGLLKRIQLAQAE
jgi:uncharacterized alpha/beta hydrolase family protein